MCILTDIAHLTILLVPTGIDPVISSIRRALFAIAYLLANSR